MPKGFDDKKLMQKLGRLARFVEKDMPRVMGNEAVNYFKDSFERQGWEGRQWKPAKRTQNNSEWYGFQSGARVKLPSSHPRRRGAKGKYQPRKTNPITNWSPAAAKRKTLADLTGDLKESIDYRVTRHGVEIYSDVPYAAVQNNGGYIKVFGKKRVRLPARQFMGNSPKLRQKIKHQVMRDINTILK